MRRANDGIWEGWLLFSIFFTALSLFAETLPPMTAGNFQNESGSRNYKLFAPQNLQTNSALLVVLHGCLMTPEQMSKGTRFNEIANKENFAVLYPEQTILNNSLMCWNWFDPSSQSRDKSEANIIAEMTMSVINDLRIDRKKVFVIGISAGGAMVSNLLACYSDIFSGGAIHSGLEYAAAQSETQAHQIMKQGPNQDLAKSAEQAVACSPARTKAIPLIVVHGSSDSTVGPINGQRVVDQFVKINQNLLHISENEIQYNKSSLVGDNGGFSADVVEVNFGKSVVVKSIVVGGMGHAWSGGSQLVPFMEPRGIDASGAIINFFLGNKNK